jgi:hypothetical protein
MDASDHSPALDSLLDTAFQDGHRRTKADLLREAADMGVPQALLARLQLVPEREYDRDQLLRALPENDDNLWRSDLRVPLTELDQALATYSFDGEVDDAAGNDSGDEELRKEEWPGPGAGGDPDPETEKGRRLRPSWDGRPGPS